MLLLTVPIALALVVAVLVLAAHLERRRGQVLVQFTLRSNAGPDTTENIIGKELAALLDAEGLEG